MTETIVSIDLWGTLIKPSPLFQEHRKLLFHEWFGSFSKNGYDNAKKAFDCVIESSGWQPTLEMIFTYICGSAALNSFFTKRTILGFAEAYQALALQYPPLIYDEHTLEIIDLWSYNYDLVLSSNTLLITSSTLKIILNMLGLDVYFSKMYFSDEMKVSKPSEKMYGGSSIHIGDNPITDGKGPWQYGIRSVIVNSVHENSNSTIRSITDSTGYIIL